MKICVGSGAHRLVSSSASPASTNASIRAFVRARMAASSRATCLGANNGSSSLR